MAEPQHRTLDEIEAGFGHVLDSPRDTGTLEMIVRRPRHDEREVLEEAEISLSDGLVGDLWRTRRSRAGARESQVTLTSSRLLKLLVGEQEFWPVAGDQLYVDFDLSAGNLPPGTRLAIGAAILEVSAKPHTGCSKYMARFGDDALEFISAPERMSLNLRGINTKVIQPGTIRVGDVVRKLA
jgi:MOSC domain-containing protein YiiM